MPTQQKAKTKSKSQRPSIRIYSAEEIAQQSPEWFAIRKLKLTASNAQAIGNNSKGLDTYVKKLMAEHFSSGERKFFSNEHTDRGNELEDMAREIYELETGQKVERVGFVEVSEHVGCSPDGLIGKDGGCEIKSTDDYGYYDLLLNGENAIDTAYLWQVQMNLLLTERKWWELCFYNPNFKKNLLIFRILPDHSKQEAIKRGIENGTRMIKEQLEFINNLS